MQKLLLCAAKSFYRSDYLLGLVSFPPGQRSGPQLATLVKYLGCLPSFKEAPLSLRLELSGSLQPTRCAPGSELAAAGEPVNAMHIIVEGSVGVFTKRSTQEDPGRSFKASGFESMKLRAASADTFSVGATGWMAILPLSHWRVSSLIYYYGHNIENNTH